MLFYSMSLCRISVAAYFLYSSVYLCNIIVKLLKSKVMLNCLFSVKSTEMYCSVVLFMMVSLIRATKNYENLSFGCWFLSFAFLIICVSYHLSFLSFAFLIIWVSYHLRFLSFEFLIIWVSYHLHFLSFEFLIIWVSYHLSFLSFEFLIIWVSYHLRFLSFAFLIICVSLITDSSWQGLQPATPCLPKFEMRHLKRCFYVSSELTFTIKTKFTSFILVFKCVLL